MSITYRTCLLCLFRRSRRRPPASRAIRRGDSVCSKRWPAFNATASTERAGRRRRTWDACWTAASHPATLAATMWNHAPGMWAAMRDRQITAGELDQQAAQDLMAFFYAARFFEKPGDAGRGKRAFRKPRLRGLSRTDVAAKLAGKSGSEAVSDGSAGGSHRAARRHVESPLRDAGRDRIQGHCAFRSSARRISPTCWCISAINRPRANEAGVFRIDSGGRRRRRIPIGRLRQVPSNGGCAGRERPRQNAHRDRGRDVEPRASHGGGRSSARSSLLPVR